MPSKYVALSMFFLISCISKNVLALDQKSWFYLLPKEIMHLIFNELGTADAKNARLVCLAFNTSFNKCNFFSLKLKGDESYEDNALTDFTKVQKICASDSQIDDNTISFINRSAIGLSTLDLAKSNVLLIHLCHLFKNSDDYQNLTHLSIQRNKIYIDDLYILNSLTGLKILNLSSTGGENNMYSLIKSHIDIKSSNPQIEHGDLSETVSILCEKLGINFGEVRLPKSLTELDLSNNQMFDGDLKYISHLTDLVRLNLCSMPISSGALKYLLSMNNLIELNIVDTAIEEEDALLLKNSLTNLTCLKHGRS